MPRGTRPPPPEGRWSRCSPRSRGLGRAQRGADRPSEGPRCLRRPPEETDSSRTPGSRLHLQGGCQRPAAACAEQLGLRPVLSHSQSFPDGPSPLRTNTFSSLRMLGTSRFGDDGQERGSATPGVRPPVHTRVPLHACLCGRRGRRGLDERPASVSISLGCHNSHEKNLFYHSVFSPVE